MRDLLVFGGMAILGILICICLVKMTAFQEIIDEIDLRRDFPNLYRPEDFEPLDTQTMLSGAIAQGIATAAVTGADLQLLADLHLNTPGDVLADKPGVDVD